jgi:hypothetical protein
VGEALEVGIDGEQAICADEGDDLVDGREEGYSIDGSQQTKDEEAGEPIGRTGLHTSNLPIFLIDATPDGLSSVKTGTKPFVMKRFMLVGVPVVLVFFVLACSKDRASTAGHLDGVWNIVTDSSYAGVGLTNHLVVYKGFAGDYFEFTGDGIVYTKEGSVLDTLRFTFLPDSVHVIISGFGLIINGVQDTSVVSDRSATSMEITARFFATPGGIFWRKVVLSK